MPKSKQHAKRKAKLNKKRTKTNKWVVRKVEAFNALPEEAKESLLQKWLGRDTAEGG